MFRNAENKLFRALRILSIAPLLLATMASDASADSHIQEAAIIALTLNSSGELSYPPDTMPGDELSFINYPESVLDRTSPSEIVIEAVPTPDTEINDSATPSQEVPATPTEAPMPQPIQLPPTNEAPPTELPPGYNWVYNSLISSYEAVQIDPASGLLTTYRYEPTVGSTPEQRTLRDAVVLGRSNWSIHYQVNGLNPNISEMSLTANSENEQRLITFFESIAPRIADGKPTTVIVVISDVNFDSAASEGVRVAPYYNNLLWAGSRVNENENTRVIHLVISIDTTGQTREEVVVLATAFLLADFQAQQLGNANATRIQTTNEAFRLFLDQFVSPGLTRAELAPTAEFFNFQ